MASHSTTLIHAVDHLVSTCIPKTINVAPRDSRQQRQQHCVTFAAEEEILEISHVDELSVEECQSLYYSKEDYRRIENENYQTVCLMKKKHYPGSKKRYFRGLEGELSGAKFESFLLAIQAVLEEKQFTNVYGEFTADDTDAAHIVMGDVYSAFTAYDAHVAHIMGVWDAEAVKAYYKEDPAVIRDQSQADNC
jgi:hypothetical protein